jgi:hypothetical protein
MVIDEKHAIPPSDLSAICERVEESAYRIFIEGRDFLTMTKCTECEGSWGARPRVPCIIDAMACKAICRDCWTREKERELCEEYLDAHRPKLDVADFAKI